MRERLISTFWGIVLIVLGGLFMAQNLGWIGEISAAVWAGLFAGASLLFFVTFFISGIQSWGWLFPACILGSLAAVIYFGERGFTGSWIAMLILWSIIPPFLVAFVSAPRQNWWALIPSYVMLAVGMIVLLAEVDIPGTWIAAGINFMIALPFFVVYLFSVKNWWALIPAGILGSVSLGLFFLGDEPGDRSILWMNLIMGGGMTLTFVILWLRRAVQPTAWAKYPAVILALGMAAVAIFGGGLNAYWPVAIILLGGWILFDALRPKAVR